MIKNECKHEWILLSPATGEQQSSKMKCQKCNIKMTASEVFQLEAFLHLQGFQKYIAIIALVISFLALLV